MNTLQNLVLPNLEVQAPQDMYLRLNALAWTELGVPRVQFTEGGQLTSDTFYGGFSVTAWKRRCDIRTLMLGLDGAGDFVVTFGLHRPGRGSLWLNEQEISLLPGRRTTIPVHGWDALEGGMLFFQVRALGRAVLTAASYVTPDAAPNDVRLGLVVTHFNRQAQVASAVERLRRSVIEQPDLRGRVTLTVVDNSRNLGLESHGDGVTVIPNRNLGGAGGFVRGLLDLLDGGAHTHALFMDDDASCEPESVLRAFAMLQYARTARLAVAGALLDESAPWRLMEKGARFDGMCRPLCSGLDMRRVEDLLRAEQDLDAPDYGGWWFFAFALSEIKRFPFPFFVRGDDVFFSLTNDFDIATLNGVACFGEDFAAKHGPMTAYLDARYHLLHALLDEKKAPRRIATLARHLFMGPLASYNYANARAFTLAMHHLLMGPRFFRDNLDMSEVRAQIGSWTPSHKMLPIDRSAFELETPRGGKEPWLRKLLRLVTLQGFLLPEPSSAKPVLLQEKSFHGNPSAVFGRRRVLYQHGPSGTGYVAEYDRSLFFAELRTFLSTFAKLLARLPRLRQAHQAGFDEMASVDFWRKVYERPAPPKRVMAEPASSSRPASSPIPTLAPATAVSSAQEAALRPLRPVADATQTVATKLAGT